MEMKPLPTVLAFLAVALSGCDSRSKDGEEVTSGRNRVFNPIVPEDVLADWGYQTVSTASLTQSKWEVEEFGEAKIRIQSIKATTQVPDWKDAYYRFTLVEEDFPSIAGAKSRIKRLKDHDPKLDAKLHPELILRNGFKMGNRVLYVTTDVLRFETEKLPTIVDALRAHVFEKEKGEPGSKD